MKAQSNTPNANVNFNYQALDEFLSKDYSHQDLSQWLNEIECEILAPSNDGTNLVVNGKVWEFFKLIKDMVPVQQEAIS